MFLKFSFQILQSKTLDIKISFTKDITPLSSNASLLNATHFSYLKTSIWTVH